MYSPPKNPREFLKSSGNATIKPGYHKIFQARNTNQLSCMQEKIELVSIGVIRSPYQNRGDAPRQGRLDNTVSEIHIFNPYRAGLGENGSSSHIFVLYWLDRSRRDLLTATPPGSGRERPVFTTRSPDRPNPIGIGIATVMEVRDGVITVTGLDALDGTPVLDIKPYSPSIDCIPDATNESDPGNHQNRS
jgi:tRNA-Thr(GGU) m(6)t(6)A37 methyltransferase TsaA